MSERLYRLEDVITEVGVGYVRASSKAEATRKARAGEVEFTYGDSFNVRRGDGIHVYIENDERQAPDS